MKIGVDKAQQAGKHDLKHNDLINMGHELVDIPIPCGDYIEITPQIEEVIKRRGDKLKKMDLIGCINISVDTKRDMSELYQCLVTGHARFSDECFLAYNNHIKLVILIENTDGVTSISNVDRWRNEIAWKRYFALCRKADREGGKRPRPPVKPSQMKAMMSTMHSRYGTEFMFCDPKETAVIISDILERGEI